MTNKEVTALKSIVKAFKTLPHAKKEFMVGYAEGVADMAESIRAQQENATEATAMPAEA